MRLSSRSPVSSNRQTSTLVALVENSAKLVPLPSQWEPSGCGRPSSIDLTGMQHPPKAPRPNARITTLLAQDCCSALGRYFKGKEPLTLLHGCHMLADPVQQDVGDVEAVVVLQ